MNRYTINSFAHYISFIEEHYNRDHIFRGIHCLDHKLIPKIGRPSYINKCDSDPAKLLNELQDIEEHAMDDFVKMSIPHQDLRKIGA